MTPLPSETPLAGLDWITRPKLAALGRLGITTLGDLLRHFPRRYEDRRRFDRFPDGETERSLCLFGTVEKTTYKRFGGRGIFEARIVDEAAGLLSSPLTVRWFNMPWMKNLLATGDRVVLFGKPRLRGRQVVMEHPEIEVIDDEGDRLVHFDRITPVHAAGDGINPRAIREIIHRAIELTTPPEFLWTHSAVPDAVWRKVHFPESDDEREEARQCLVREEFFGIQIIVCGRHAEATAHRGAAKPGTGELWDRVRTALPFEITGAQSKAISEIGRDLASDRRMNRLLQGDVGSGKTLVALRAMLQVAESGWQAALMAPTQILAEQHFLNFRRLLAPLGIPVELRTAARKESSGAPSDVHEVLPGLYGEQAGSGFPSLVVGTHALLFESTAFERLGLVVIDEQHKFGVLQRSRLISRGDAPDVLVMTATPIPRTITQTLYGDLDVSILSEKPAGRGEVITAVRTPAKLPEITAFLRKELENGRQAYIVYPLVETSEKLEAKAATAEFEKWRSILAPLRVGLVHGRLDPAAKEAVMQQFRDGTISCLVATTVIEVGVDVPNASIMLIENAGRFGLSQIHQLRGRIGRGSQKSYCILLDEDPSAAAIEKLRVLEKTADGFEIAEADLQIRGPGDLLGTAQTGLPPLRLGDLLRDGELMTEARAAARRIFAADPKLSAPDHEALRRHLDNARRSLEAVAG